jgi:hypothetical protein
MALPVAADIRNFLEGYDITSSVLSDDWINRQITNFIIPQIEKIIRSSMSIVATKSEYISGNGEKVLLLNRKPIISVTEVKYISAFQNVVALIQGIEVDATNGILIMKGIPIEGVTASYFAKGNKNIKVTYTYGVGEQVLLKDAIVKLAAKMALVQIGARTGGGSLSVQAFNRNYGNRGMYTDLINNLDMEAFGAISNWMAAVQGS